VGGDGMILGDGGGQSTPLVDSSVAVIAGPLEPAQGIGHLVRREALDVTAVGQIPNRPHELLGGEVGGDVADHWVISLWYLHIIDHRGPDRRIVTD